MNVGERYVLGRLVGEGATALVYEAQDSRSRREVAVKVFRDLDLGGGGGVERIDEETRILASLAHPSLLPVYDSGRDADGHRFIVMPLVRGTTLAKRLVDGPVGPAEVRRIGRALSLALAHIHARGIVHRDVKPSNVLLADDGTPYLADFGFARAADGPALTATGYIVGTAGYLAPEQADGLPVGPPAVRRLVRLATARAGTGAPDWKEARPMSEAIELAIGAAVQGDEGFVGEVERIDLDSSGSVALLVAVRPRHEGGTARLIPVAALRAGPDGLRLDRTLEGFEEFPAADGLNP